MARLEEATSQTPNRRVTSISALVVVGVGIGDASRGCRHFGNQLAQQAVAELLEKFNHGTYNLRCLFQTDFIRRASSSASVRPCSVRSDSHPHARVPIVFAG
jgi:hypothetical protein